MKRHRSKRYSGALDRYMKESPLKAEGGIFTKSEKLKVENPLAEFEKEQEPRQIQACEPKQEKQEVQIEIPAETIPADTEITNDDNMPLFCNNCNIQKACPYGRAMLRKDQKKLIVCKKRVDFRQLITDAGVADRQGLLTYIHKLRRVNQVRIARLLYKEALTGGGQDRYLSLLIDKQVDNAMQEIKLITPQEKNINNISYQLTHIHNTVDAYNELPNGIKQYLLGALKNKLAQLKDPINRLPINNKLLNSNIQYTNNGFGACATPGGAGGKETGSLDGTESIEEL